MKRISISILVAAAVILLLCIFIIPRAGSYLVVDHGLVEADALVVLMGSVPARVLETADLYHEEYGQLVLMVRSYSDAEELLVERGIQLQGDAELTRDAALQLGIPAEQVVIIPGQARSTRDEAVVLYDYLDENETIESIILVTSSFHTRRTLVIFKHVLSGLDREIFVQVRASRYDSFQPEQWWQDRESAKQVLYEYLKLAYFYGWESYR